MTYQYDDRAAQYRDTASGMFVSRSRILMEVSAESERLKTRLAGHARVLLSNKIDVREYQIRVADDLKASTLRMTLFASGGKSKVDKTQYLTVGRLLQDEYRRLAKFGRAIAAGQLTEKQIIQRSKQYANVSTVAYFKAEKFKRSNNGFNAAKRTLDPQAKHCVQCLQYTTRGQWLPIGSVVEPGTRCSCAGNCKCTIAYRYIPFIGSANLQDLTA